MLNTKDYNFCLTYQYLVVVVYTPPHLLQLHIVPPVALPPPISRMERTTTIHLEIGGRDEKS